MKHRCKGCRQCKPLRYGFCAACWKIIFQHIE